MGLAWRTKTLYYGRISSYASGSLLASTLLMLCEHSVANTAHGATWAGSTETTDQHSCWGFG